MKSQKKTLEFTAVIYPDAESDWLAAHNPETGTTTQGMTFEEALANLKEATELYLSEFPKGTKGRAILPTCCNTRLSEFLHDVPTLRRRATAILTDSHSEV